MRRLERLGVNFAVGAPSGMSALNVGGETLHRLAGFGVPNA
jgi:hypothetical protein